MEKGYHSLFASFFFLLSCQQRFTLFLLDLNQVHEMIDSNNFIFLRQHLNRIAKYKKLFK